MPDDGAVPPYRLTHAQAAALLGVSMTTIGRLVASGELPHPPQVKAGILRADVERLSARRWHPGDPGWITTTEVAGVLGVSQPRVSQLARRGFLPFEHGSDGRRLFRPAQVAVIARARRERWGRRRGQRAV